MNQKLYTSINEFKQNLNEQVNFMSIRKLQSIHDTYFDPDSEYLIDENIFSTLADFEVITGDEQDRLTLQFDTISNDVWAELGRLNKQALGEMQNESHIDKTIQRTGWLREIYDILFNPKTDTYFDSNKFDEHKSLFFILVDYDIITRSEADVLFRTFKRIESDLFNKLKEIDTERLKKK